MIYWSLIKGQVFTQALNVKLEVWRQQQNILIELPIHNSSIIGLYVFSFIMKWT